MRQLKPTIAHAQMRFYRGPAPATRKGDPLGAPSANEGRDKIAANIGHVLAIERRGQEALSASDHLADSITRFSGSMLYVWLHVTWFALWIGANLVFFTFDSFPFGLLTMIVSLEAIFLSTFVLISQNRQSLIAEKREKVHLQINMLAEQEITKLLQLIVGIHEHLGLNRGDDEEVKELAQGTDVGSLAQALEDAEAPVPDAAAPSAERTSGD